MLNKLTNRKVKGRLKAGRHSDGGGLYLNVTKSGARSWVFMWTREGRRREIGLGGLNSVSLASAREKAAQCRTSVQEGADPKEAMRRPQSRSFGELCKAYIEHRVIGKVHRANELQWVRLTEVLCKEIQNRDVKSISTEDVLKMLRPIWLAKPETARKSRARLENLFDYAKGLGWTTGENPARWKGNLSAVLPQHDRSLVKHHPAMPFSEMPMFFRKLVEREATSAKALSFLILTASRTSEVLHADRSEFDLEKKIWSVPAERMKNRKPHAVPLSTAACEVLKPLLAANSSHFVFPGTKTGKPLSNMAMSNLLKRMNVDPSHAVVHGFRSSFRDWVGEKTEFPRELAELALSHTVGSQTEQAYRRGSALEKRRHLMQCWAEFCLDMSNENVVRLHG